MVPVSVVPSGGNKESTARVFLDNCRGLLLTVYFSKSDSNILLKEEMLLVIAALTQPRRGVVVRSSGDRAWAAGVLQPRPHSVITPTPCAHLHLPWGLTQIRTYFNTYRINETFLVWDIPSLLFLNQEFVNANTWTLNNFFVQINKNQIFRPVVHQPTLSGVAKIGERKRQLFTYNEKEKDCFY